jgi:predicted  nucleic acid-binding Zn-ribbon protein
MILRILAIVAALAAGALFFLGKGKLAEQHAAQLKAEQATVAVQAELATANDQVSKLENNLKNEREALADEKRKLESVRSEMYTAKQEVSRTQQQLSEGKRSIQDLESTVKSLRSDLLKSEQDLMKASKEAELAQLNERIAELEESNADLKESLEMAKERAASHAAGAKSNNGTLTAGGSYSSTFNPTASQPLPTASIGAETTIQSLSAQNGLIVLANNPELGLAPGSQVTIVKDLKALGKIQVVQVTDTSIVANILPGAKTREMTEGSTIKLLNK